ncbi:MAG TPA: hypothetical protein VHB48_07140 [Chitinophagaceae bacterium]|nr:hypothetical protein [Chitinophagaceae bacterium]
MKRLITLFSALFLLAGLASAQKADTTFRHGFAGRHMPMRPAARQNAMRGIQLTDDQKTQMKTINDDYRKQLNTLQSNNSITLGEYKTQLAALQKDHRQKVNSVFTDDQKKLMADRRQKMKGRMQKMGAANLQQLKSSLGLSDDQVAKIKSQRQNTQAELKTLRSDSTLLPAQKREKVKEIFARQKEQMKSILTPGQQSKLESMQKERMNHLRPRTGAQADQVK